jgi:hypothetical protein
MIKDLTQAMVECGLQLIWPEHLDKYVRDVQKKFLNRCAKCYKVIDNVFHILMGFFRKLIADKHSTGGIGDKVKKTCEFKHLLE